MGDDDDTVELFLTSEEVLRRARERLDTARQLLDPPLEILLDDGLAGAALLASDASELVEVLVRRRLEDRRAR